MHGILFVSVVALEVKGSKFHFCNKEYPFVCATVQFDLIFLNSACYKNALKILGPFNLFLENKIFRTVRLKCMKSSLQISDCKTIWENSATSHTRIKPYNKVLHFTETVLNITFSRNSTGNSNSEKFKVHNFSSICTIMPNRDDNYKVILKELY